MLKVDEGYTTVATYYFRYSDSFPGELYAASYIRGWGFRAKGGYTAVVIRDDNTNKYHIGVSRCSEKDSFVKLRGRELAYERALIAAKSNIKFLLPEPAKNDERFRSMLIGSLHDSYIYDYPRSTAK